MTPYPALLGTWRMVSWQREVIGTEAKADALGPDPVGFINYGPDGRFYALLVKRNRPRPAKLPASDEEKIVLFDGMLAYAGTYTVDPRKPCTTWMLRGMKHGPVRIRSGTTNWKATG